MKRPIHALFFMQEMLQLEDISRLTSSVEIQMSSFFSLHTCQIPLQHFWMFTGTAKRKLYVPVHQICLSEETQNSLLAFHSIAGCDTTSQFAGIGKQSSWSIFVTCPRLLQHLGKDESPEEKVLCDAEAFICQLYNKGREETLINRERASAFRKAKKSLDSLPPTQDTPHLHIKRAHYQTFIWKKALEPCPVLLNPEGYGWHCEEDIRSLSLQPKNR